MKKQPKAKTLTNFTMPFGWLKDWHAMVVIAGGIAIFFRDILSQSAFLWDDFLYFIYPIRNFAAVSLSQGEIPFWNPYTFSGMPFYADIQSGIFYLPNLLMTLFVSDGHLHFFWVEMLTIAHYVIGGVCMYYLARSFGLQRIFALVSGFVYPLSGFMIAHSIHLVHICQMSWFPLVLLLFRKALVQRSFQHTIVGGLVLGLAALVGFPQVTLHIFFFLFLFFLFEFYFATRETGLKNSWLMAVYAGAFILISVGVMAIQFIPTLEIVSLSVRSDISYENTIIGSVSWKQLLAFIIPNYFGTTHQQEVSFWLTSNYYEYWETVVYLGIVPLVALIVAATLIKQNRYIVFLFVIMVFGFLFALGDNFFVYPFFYKFVPGFDKFRVPGRLSLYTVFASSLLSGFAFQRMFTPSFQETKLFRRLPFVVLAVAAVAWLSAQMELFQPLHSARQYEAIHTLASNEATKAVMLIVILAGILFLFTKKVFHPSLIMAAVLVFHVADINIFGFNYVNGKVNPQEYFGRGARLVDFLKEEGKKEYVRLNARQGGAMLLDRNQGMIDRVFMMEGFGALVLQRMNPPRRTWDETCDLLNAKYRIVIDEQRQTMSMREATTYVPRAFMVYQTRVIEDEPNVKSFLESNEFDPKRIALLEEQPSFILLDTAHTDAWSATITSYHLNSLTVEVETPKDGVLILSEVYCPGWRAYVDGVEERVYRADWSLRAIPVRAGKHNVVMYYVPEGYYQGMWITLATLGLSLGGIVYSKRMGTKEIAASTETKANNG